MTTIDTLNDGQVRAVKAIANANGDTELVRVCDIALDGDYVARRQILKELNFAETGKRIPSQAMKERSAEP